MNDLDFFKITGGISMSKTLDFNTIKKDFIRIVLPDENKTIIKVLPPSKQLYEDVSIVKERLQQLLDADPDDLNNEDIVGDIYEIVAKCMSRNSENIIITKQKLEDILDFYDVWKFLDMYVKELINKQKN